MTHCLSIVKCVVVLRRVKLVLYIVQSAYIPVKYTVCTVHFGVYNMLCAMYTGQCAMCTVHCIVCNVS